MIKEKAEEDDSLENIKTESNGSSLEKTSVLK